VLGRTKEHRTRDLALLRTVPGVGKILALTIALEINDIERFASRQDFSSYARLISSVHMSNGKVVGSAGRKIGNPYLRWALGEVAMHASHKTPGINALRQRYEKKHGAGQALSILAHKFGRAIYYMLKNGTVFDEERFLRR
jgi:transposase